MSIITVVPALQRKHVTRPEEWNRAGGTDYWAVFGPKVTTAPAGSSALISDYGWTTTSLVETAGALASLIASTDRTAPAHVLTDALGDLLQSPRVFGDYGHAQIAASILGYQPTTLNCEWYGAMTVNSANESTSCFGLILAGGSPANQADEAAVVATNGSAFVLFGANAAQSSSGAAVNALWHKFKIVMSNTVAAGTNMTEWFIDDTSQGKINLAIDIFPVSFGMYASTTNRPAISWLHIWYA